MKVCSKNISRFLQCCCTWHETGAKHSAFQEGCWWHHWSNEIKGLCDWMGTSSSRSSSRQLKLKLKLKHHQTNSGRDKCNNTKQGIAKQEHEGVLWSSDIIFWIFQWKRQSWQGDWASEVTSFYLKAGCNGYKSDCMLSFFENGSKYMKVCEERFQKKIRNLLTL